MILAAACRVMIVAAAIGIAADARADVLELGADGARWVTGPRAGQPAVADPAAAPASASEWADAPALPDYAIADPARHAAAIPPRYAAKIAEFSGLPLQIEAQLPRQSLAEITLPFHGKAAAESISANVAPQAVGSCARKVSDTSTRAPSPSVTEMRAYR